DGRQRLPLGAGAARALDRRAAARRAAARSRGIVVRKILVACVVLLALWVWRSELFQVTRPAAPPRPLELRPAPARRAVRVLAVLPQIPVGMRRLESGNGVVLVHYWAPWEHDGRAQAAALDSLRREPGLEDLE